MALELVLIVRAREHGAPPAAVGVMVAGIGIGGLIGSLFAPAVARGLPSPVIVIGLFWVEAMLLPLLALTHDPYLLGVIAGALALGGPTWNAVLANARPTLSSRTCRHRRPISFTSSSTSRQPDQTSRSHSHTDRPPDSATPS